MAGVKLRGCNYFSYFIGIFGVEQNLNKALGENPGKEKDEEKGGKTGKNNYRL